MTMPSICVAVNCCCVYCVCINKRIFIQNSIKERNAERKQSASSGVDERKAKQMERMHSISKLIYFLRFSIYSFIFHSSSLAVQFSIDWRAAGDDGKAKLIKNNCISLVFRWPPPPCLCWLWFSFLIFHWIHSTLIRLFVVNMPQTAYIFLLRFSLFVAHWLCCYAPNSAKPFATVRDCAMDVRHNENDA